MRRIVRIALLVATLAGGLDVATLRADCSGYGCSQEACDLLCYQNPWCCGAWIVACSGDDSCSPICYFVPC